ncbi:MAG: S8 family serine peptidase [Candidatus Marinimicrobia bacterium]|nr:S8 family serine peptidase [Candidatus Neomarinimicrobiota bacterium]
MQKSVIFILVLSVFLIGAEFTLLPRKTKYTKPFFNKHPEYNGNNVTIFIMDTGVEMSLPGLKKNPDGSVKVVDVFDASRSGDVKYVKAQTQTIDSVEYLTDGEEIFLSDYNEFYSEEKEFYIGALKEAEYQNSEARDINGNGETDDQWGFISFQNSSNEWVLVMDTDANGSLKGEDKIQEYRQNHNYILLPRKNPIFQHQWMSLAINFYPERKVVNFHFDDGAHGTHVAGIAAGYHLNGDSDINGLAPAAHIVSIKIGNGAAPGSATNTGSKKRGLEFIERYMEKQGGYGVINLSFGIESSNEGFSEADKLFNDFAKNNPNVVVCTSAGNEGPGVSSIGTPAAGQFLISSGAVMYHTTARDEYGWDLNSPRITSFSSRGGEVAKPDVISPGAMISTVPQWAGGDFYWGTSMASPYTAGEIACVLSGLQAKYPKQNKISSALIQHGLRETSQPLEDYKVLDQGAGMVDMLELFEWLEDEIDKPTPLNYHIATETFVPHLPKLKSNSIFWRIYDTNDIKDECDVTIKPVFPERTYQTQLDQFFIKYHLDSDSRWAHPAQRNISISRDNETDIKVELNTEGLDKNSYKTAKITLTPDHIFQDVGQEFWVTAINPLHFTKDNEFSYSIEGEKVAPGHTKRYFLAVPYGASSMNVHIQAEEDEYAMLNSYLFDEDGLPAGRLHAISSDNENYEVDKRFTDLDPGVLELTTYGSLAGEEASEYDLEVSFSGIQFNTEETKNLNFNGGNGPSFSGTVTPVLDSYQHVQLHGSINGYTREHTLSFGNSDTLSVPFRKNANDATVKFKIHMPLKFHTNFTDIVILAENSEGKFVHSSSILAKGNTFTLPSSLAEGSYQLKIMPAYVDYANKEKFELPLDEIHIFSEQYKGSHNFEGNALYQGLEYPYTISLSSAPPIIPDDTYFYGELNIMKRGESIATREIKLEK